MSYTLIKPNDNIQRIINFANVGDTLIFPAIKLDLNKYHLKSGLIYIGVGTISKPLLIKDQKDIEINGFIFKSTWFEKLIKKYNYGLYIVNCYNMRIIGNRTYI